MSVKYALNFASDTLTFDGKIKLIEGPFCDTGQSQHFVVISNDTLVSYKYVDNKLLKNASVQLTSAKNEFLYVTKTSSNIPNVILLKTSTGIEFYRCTNDKIVLLLKTDDYDENDFHDVYDWDKPNNKILFGQFYHDANLIGVMTLHVEYGVKFYAIMRDELLKKSYPIWPLDSSLDMLNGEHPLNTNYFLSDLKNIGKELVVTLGTDHINVYEFNKDEKLVHVFKIDRTYSGDALSEKLFFANLTSNSPYKEIVLINTNGLFLYKYNKVLSNYEFVHHNVMFSNTRGWSVKHSESIRFFDVNSDGRDEIIFTGPHGIGIIRFNDDINEWDTLMDGFNLNVYDRLTNIRAVLPPSSKKFSVEGPLIVTSKKNVINWANLNVMYEEAFENEEIIIDENVSNKTAIVPKIVSNLKEEKPTLLLRLNVDYTNVLESVDKNTGRLKFNLPLINLSRMSSSLKFEIFYDGTSVMSDILGMGWSISQNLIILNHESSIYPEDETYYIIVGNIPQELEYDKKTSTATIKSFKFTDLNVRYYVNDERWELTKKDMRQRYGRFKEQGATNWELTWNNWRGIGSSKQGQKRSASAWYLAEANYKGNVIHFTYDTIEDRTSSGTQFTREILLKKIEDNRGNQIVLNYGNKSKSEYVLPKSIDNNNGIINTQKTQSKYLAKCIVNTTNFKQEIQFDYKLIDGKRFLTSINQIDDDNGPIFRFNYKKLIKTYVMDQIVLPTGASSRIDYNVMKHFESFDEIITVYDVEENYSIDRGVKDILISYINRKGQVILKMYDEYTNTILPYKFPPIGRGLINSHRVYRGDGYFAITIFYKSDMELYLFHTIAKNDDNEEDDHRWSVDFKYYDLTENTNVRFGTDFIIVKESKSSVDVIEWNVKDRNWTRKIFMQNFHTSPLIVCQNKLCVLYDERTLRFGHKDNDGKWSIKTSEMFTNTIKTIKDTTNRFVLSEKDNKLIQTLLINNALQMDKNLIALTKLTSNGLQLYTEIDYFVINRDYTIANRKNVKLTQDNLNDIKHEVSGQDGNYFRLAYVLENNRFKVTVDSLRGPIMDEIRRQSPTEAIANKRVIEVKNEVLKKLGNPFLINLEKYFHYMTYRRGICNKTKVTYDGFNWNVSELKDEEVTSVPLGNSLVLRKIDAKYQLYRQNDLNRSIIDLDVKHLNQTLIKYPIYLTREDKLRGNEVITFSQDGTDVLNQIKLPQNANIVPQSTENTLITSTYNYKNAKNVTLTFKPMRRWDNVVVVKTILRLNDVNERLKGYDYDKRSVRVFGNTFYYGNTTTAPGNDPETYGYVTDSIAFDGGTKSFQKVYDSDGNLIRTFNTDKTDKKRDEQQEDNEIYANTTLYDNTKRLEIVQFFPYKIQNEEASYYGFENYEMNMIGEKKRWHFERNDIVSDGYSLTGTNYLELNKNELKGTFFPKNQFEIYVASTWIRPTNINNNNGTSITVGGNVPYLIANIFTEDGQNVYTSMSEAKLQLNDWYYLEVIIDPLYTRKLYKHQDLKDNNRDNVKFKISITISGNIHVDHVRFSPLRNKFNINVYHPKYNVITDYIHHNGLIERLIYDKFYKRQVSTIDAYGQLGELSIEQTSNGDNGPKSSLKIIPEYGFNEDFTPRSFRQRWTIEKETSWTMAPNKLRHVTNESDHLKLNRINDFKKESYGIRLFYQLETKESSIEFDGLFRIVEERFPRGGELLLIIEKMRFFVWIDDVLYLDGHSSKSINENFTSITMRGPVTISNVLLFSNPQVVVSYYNELDEKIQEVALESSNSAIVTGYYYDELGRQTITTVPTRLIRHDNESLLTYYDKFVTNGNPSSMDSIWKTHELRGQCADIVGKHAYSQTTYHDNPLNEKSADGMPGKEFSVTGSYGRRYSSTCNNILIKELYPIAKNYTYLTEYRDAGVEDVSIYDGKNNRVAWYVNVPGSSNILSTYEYDENNKLIKMLSPLYHERAGTLGRLDSSSRNLTLEETMAVRSTYDQKGNLLTKTTPDTGKITNFYGDDGFLKYTAYYKRTNRNVIDNVVYFTYDSHGRIASTGKLLEFDLKLLHNTTISSDKKLEYQQFYYNDMHRKPLLRNNLRRFVTMNDGEPFIEESILNVNEETLSKRIIVPVQESSDEPILFAINKKYVAGMLKELEYPIEMNGRRFKLIYDYDKFHKVSRIGTIDDQGSFLSVKRNGLGLIETEHYILSSAHNFTRSFKYNEPGFLYEINDKFLKEKLYYTSDSYGGLGHGDGTITRTEFLIKWHDYYDSDEIGLNENSFVNDYVTIDNSRLCFKKLKEFGYLDERNRQTRIFYPYVEQTFPIVCRYGSVGRRIAYVLGRDGFPTRYGHSYDYGNHKELTKAKYYVGGDDDILQPLKPDTFSKEIIDVNVTLSHDIWKKLSKSGFIIIDNDKGDLTLGQGKRGKSFLNENLFEDLLKIGATGYKLPLQMLITSYIADNKLANLKNDFKAIFNKWNADNTNARLNQIADGITKMLVEKNYFDNPYAIEFLDVMKQYEPLIPNIVSTLWRHFSRQLGEAEFDVESYGIDSNGNHKHYYTGFDRYVLEYDKLTNRIDNVNYQSFNDREPERNFKMVHDDRGNVVQALHKGIKRIVYDPVSNRTRLIALVDGTSVVFAYDSQGNRVLKMVMKEGRTLKKVYYIRDDGGRSLIEKELRYYSKDLPPDILITIYIYNENKLIGFIRRDEFYSVMTDHEGSIRLIIRNGEVVAAYDYLPYGNTMRVYGNNPEAHITYRYTGQEWDEETRLYNYQARFYDPDIGRFYQIDPKEQYFSPYKYAGNSPISKIDPDGQFAFLIAAIVFAVVGAYLGGAAANRNPNPLKWDWKSPKTYLGIVGGAVAGALLPAGFVGSVTFLTGLGLSTTLATSLTVGAGLAAAYFKIGATLGEWNPGKWNFASMELWNAAFEGFSLGTGAFHAVGSIKQFFGRLSTKGKVLFVAGSTLSGTGIFVLNGYVNEWDFSKPGIYFGFIDAITSASDIPMFMSGTAKFIGKNAQKIRKNFKTALLALKSKNYVGNRINRFLQKWRDAKNTVEVIKVLHGSGNLLMGTVAVGVGGFFMASGENDSFNEWSNSGETYFAFITGAIFGSNLGSATKSFYRKLKVPKKVKTSEPVVNMMDRIAGEVVETYQRAITDNGVDLNSLDYNRQVKVRLQEGKIPNSAVAIAVTNDMVIAAFSTNRSPGYIVYYQRRNGGDATILFEKFVINNVEIGDGPVVLHENLRKNLELLQATESRQDSIRITNKDDFNEGHVEQRMREIIVESGLVEDVKLNNLINAVNEKFNDVGYLTKDFLSKQLQDHTMLKDLNERKNTIQVDIRKEKAKYKKVKNPSEEQKIAFDKQILEYNRQIEGVDFKMRAEVEKIKEVTAQLWPEVKDYEGALTQWDPTNCAEPHCLTAATRAEEIIEVQNDNLNYNIQREDILFMGTYKLDKLPELTPFPRCDHCLITTKDINNIVTDTEWRNWLSKFKDSNKKLNFALERLYFKLPYFDLLRFWQNSSLRNSVDDYQEPVLARKRRSNFKDELKMAKSGATKTTSWLNNCIYWFKDSFQLFREELFGEERNKNNDDDNGFNTMGIDDTQFKHVDINGTTLLLDYLLARYNRRKIFGTFNIDEQIFSDTEGLGFALDITEKFAIDINEISLKYDLNELTVDYEDLIRMQIDIRKNIMRGKYDMIHKILTDNFWNVCNEHDLDETIIREVLFEFDGIITNRLTRLYEALDDKFNVGNRSGHQARTTIRGCDDEVDGGGIRKVKSNDLLNGIHSNYIC